MGDASDDNDATDADSDSDMTDGNRVSQLADVTNIHDGSDVESQSAIASPKRLTSLLPALSLKRKTVSQSELARKRPCHGNLCHLFALVTLVNHFRKLVSSGIRRNQ